MKRSASSISSWVDWFDRSAKYYKDPRMKMAYYDNGKPVPMRVMKAIHKDVWCKMKATRLHALLDVGCGTGLFEKTFRPNLRSIVGTDTSLTMLRHARRLNPRCRFIACDSCHLPFLQKVLTGCCATASFTI